jgi:hypothetical protein
MQFIPNASSWWKFTSVQASALLAVLGALTAALPAVQSIIPVQVFGAVAAIIAACSIFLRVWKQSIPVEPEVKAEMVNAAVTNPVKKEEVTITKAPP